MFGDTGRRGRARTGRRSQNSIRSQIESLRESGGLVEQEPKTGAAEPVGSFVRVVDPLLGDGTGTVSQATTTSGDPLEAMPAEVISARARRGSDRNSRHALGTGDGRRVRNPHTPHIVRTAEQRRRTAGEARSGIGPIRDTGMRMMSRRERHAITQKRRQGAAVAGVIALIVGLFALGWYWMESSDKMAALVDLTVSGLGASGTATDAGADGTPGGSLEASDTPSGEGTAALISEATSLGVTVDTPNPILGTCAGVDVYLPVSMYDLTEVALHQANYSYAIQMETHMPQMDPSDAKGVGTKRDKSIQRFGSGELLVGSYIEMWRTGRDAKQRTAADCGAKAGSVVFAPVSGTVTSVKTYKLEGKATDYEIHIAPDGTKNIEAVVIHITDVVVRAGDHLLGGVTPIARVMDTAAVVRNQLATYAGAKGNHAHIQFNDTDSAEYLARH